MKAEINYEFYVLSNREIRFVRLFLDLRKFNYGFFVFVVITSCGGRDYFEFRMCG